VSRGLATGTFTHAGSFPAAAGQSSPFVVAEDFNRDGIPDLAVANAADHAFSVLLGVASDAGTPNGVFGAKVMWGYFNGFVDSLRDVLGNAVLPTRTVLERSFPNLDSWIFMTRDDKLRQAISLWKAIQNWTWKRDHGAGAVITHDLRYSFDAIDHLQRQLQHEEREWQAWFAEAGIEPFAVVYEDFAKRYEETAADILAFLRVDVPPSFGQRRMTRQSDDLTELWVERYLREAAAVTGKLSASTID